MSNNENMIHNFQNMISNLENETKLLKFSFFLRQNTSTSHDMNKELSKLHANIDNFQNDLTEFEDFLDSELNLLNQLNELTHLTQQQHQNIQRISSSLPSFFHDKKKNITFLDDPKNGVSKSAAASSAVGGNEEEIKDLLIELNEFENIPKSTRSRLTLEQIIIALNNIQRLIIQKGERLSTQQKLRSSSQITALEEYRSLQHIDHQGKMFLTEKELRASVIFEGGDATGRAILQTLRALHRIKLIRSNGESTYILTCINSNKNK